MRVLAVYEGEWQRGVPHGQGCFTSAAGDVYQGTCSGLLAPLPPPHAHSRCRRLAARPHAWPRHIPARGRLMLHWQLPFRPLARCAAPLARPKRTWLTRPADPAPPQALAGARARMVTPTLGISRAGRWFVAHCDTRTAGRTRHATRRSAGAHAADCFVPACCRAGSAGTFLTTSRACS